METTKETPLNQHQFIENSNCIESNNYYHIFLLKNEFVIGNYRIPKNTVNDKSSAIIDAYEWYLEMNFSEEAKFQLQIEKFDEGLLQKEAIGFVEWIHERGYESCADSEGDKYYYEEDTGTYFSIKELYNEYKAARQF